MSVVMSIEVFLIQDVWVYDSHERDCGDQDVQTRQD